MNELINLKLTIPFLLLICREYCPEYERLKKLQMEARVKHKAKQMKKFEEDVESEGQSIEITSQRRATHQNEILLRNRAVGGESSDEQESEEENG